MPEDPAGPGGRESRRVLQPRLTLLGHTGAVDACAISADAGLIASAGEDIAVRIWDGRTGALPWTLGPVEAVPPALTPAGAPSGGAPDDPISRAFEDIARGLGFGIGSRAVGISADGRYAAEVSDEFLTLWSLERSAEWDPSIREQLACVSWPGGAGPDADEAWVQACWIDESASVLRVWFALRGDDVIWADFELEDGVLMEMGERTSGARHLALRPDGGALVAIASARSVTVSALPQGRPGNAAHLIALAAHDRSAGLDSEGLVFSVGVTHGIVGQGDAASVFSVAAPATPAVPATPAAAPVELLPITLDGQIVACCVARDRPVGGTACAGSRSAPVCVWDLESRSIIASIPAEDVTDCAISADGHVLVTTSNPGHARERGEGGVVQVWDV